MYVLHLFLTPQASTLLLIKHFWYVSNNLNPHFEMQGLQFESIANMMYRLSSTDSTPLVYARYVSGPISTPPLWYVIVLNTPTHPLLLFPAGSVKFISPSNKKMSFLQAHIPISLALMKLFLGSGIFMRGSSVPQHLDARISPREIWHNCPYTSWRKLPLTFSPLLYSRPKTNNGI